MRVKQANLTSPRARHEGDAPAQGSTTDHGNRAAGDLFLSSNAHSSVLSSSFSAVCESGIPGEHSCRQTRKYTRGRTVRLGPCPNREPAFQLLSESNSGLPSTQAGWKSHLPF